MPVFNIDVEFEVFCKCGNGLCNVTDIRDSRRRSMPQAVVEACDKCTGLLQDRIDDLQDELEDLRKELACFR